MALYVVVALLHAAGWGLYLHFASQFPALVGLGLVAYLFGVRHAFDADHIAAIDDTVRYLLHKRQVPLGIGLSFSLGHSTIVLGLALAISLAGATVKHALPALRSAGGLIGTGVSGVFLCVIGILNLLVMLDILKIWRRSRGHGHDHFDLDRLLLRRGLLNRFLRIQLQDLVSHSWKMYPLGMLFGLGFDTASEVALLAMTAGASAGNLPVAAVLCLPILFAAGMTLLDTTDGVLMSAAYSWAHVNPLRKMFYNLATTGLSVGVAMTIGCIEVLQVLASVLHLHGWLHDFLAQVDFGRLGYLIVALFIVGWMASIAVWKIRRPAGRTDCAIGGPAL